MTARSWSPAVFYDYRPNTWRDVTNQSSNAFPSKVPVLVIEGEWDDETFAKLRADPNYAVLWVDADKQTPPDLAACTACLVKHGAESADLQAAVKQDATTKSDLAVSLNTWIKDQPINSTKAQAVVIADTRQ